MKTVLICNQKGGVGKTLIADEIVFALQRDEIPYNYYDLDNQGSSIHENIENENAIVQVIDTPGALQEDLIKWIESSDMIIVPTKLTTRDIGPLETMIKILEPYKEKKEILFVLNGWNRYTASKQFVEWFTEKYPDLNKCILCQSEKFTLAGAYGKSIVDIKSDALPTKQIEYIYSIVKYKLKLSEGWL